MLQLFSRLKTWWSEADRSQRLITVGGLGALIFLMVITAFFATRTRFTGLYNGLSDTEKGEIVEVLTKEGIKVETGESGKIAVPEGMVEQARVKVALAGKQPKNGSWDFGDGDLSLPWNASPEMESQKILSNMSSRIARTLEAMDGVELASVTISQPKERAFANDQEKPKASVTVQESSPGSLNRDNGRTIADVVANAVAGMTINDVVVVTGSMRRLWNGADEENGSGTSKAETDKKISDQWASDLQSKLDLAFGPQSTIVMAVANVDLDRKAEEVNSQTPSEKPAEIVRTKEDMQGGKKRAAASGPAGGESNIGAPASQDGPETDGDKYKNANNREIFPVSTKRSTTDFATGGLRSLSLSVIVNETKVPDPALVKGIIDGILKPWMETDAAGVPLPKQAFTATVTSVKFDTTAAENAKNAAAAAAKSQQMQQIASLLPIAAILFVALLVAKQVSRISKSVMPEPVAEVVGDDLDLGPDALEAGQVLEYDENGDPIPNAAIAALEASHGHDELDMLPPEIKDRINLPLEAIKKMAQERPQMVATLIKSMLLGDRP